MNTNENGTKTDILMLTTIGLMVAMAVVFRSYLAIMVTPQFRLSFEFLPIAIIAMKYGPWKAGTAYMMVDLIAFWLFPRGIYFPGFTFTAFLAGSAYGFFLYKKPTNNLNAALAAIAVVVFIQLGLETLWLSIMFGDAYMVLLGGRIIRTVIMLPLQFVVIKLAATGMRVAKLA
ncbi:MAG: folate family ECF transporter S component [Defluviitaleaceae bacterium]|nr:folate family ECF transporter S component [Defluviitaleaceae bacterium]